MRLLGELENEDQARLFSDYLAQLGIENQVIEEPDEAQIKFEIWVHAEDELERSEELLKKFQKDPDDVEYQGADKKVKEINRQARKEDKKHPGYMDARTTIFNKGHTRQGSLTLLLILACLAVAIFSKLGANTDALKPFFITEYFREGGYIYWKKGLQEIMKGEIWRLFTPMFIHFGIMHFVFNMLWLKDLGSMVEDRKGSIFLAVFVLIVSISSNFAQYLVSGPSFGGMSGVVYGLLGYIWMKGKYDPGSNMSLHKTTVVMMTIWFFLGFTGILGPIANAVHAVGLVIGVAWGYISSKAKTF